MRARLHALMPDLEEEIEDMCYSICRSAAPTYLHEWFHSMEDTLCKMAGEGDTNLCVTQLPRLKRLCSDAQDLLDAHKDKGAGAEVLATELGAFCKVYVAHWRAHSDVDLAYSLDASELLRSKGKDGLRLSFDWTPSAAESKQKKHKK